MKAEPGLDLEIYRAYHPLQITRIGVKSFARGTKVLLEWFSGKTFSDISRYFAISRPMAYHIFCLALRRRGFKVRRNGSVDEEALSFLRGLWRNLPDPP